MTDIERALSTLRHAYWNLVNGHVSADKATEFANGLIAPVIEALEKHIEKERKE